MKASISPEAAEAARKMGQEALRKRLEEIRMSEADWQRYREIVTFTGKACNCRDAHVFRWMV